LTLISLDTVTAVRAREKKKKEKKKRRTVPARRDHFCGCLALRRNLQMLSVHRGENSTNGPQWSHFISTRHVSRCVHVLSAILIAPESAGFKNGRTFALHAKRLREYFTVTYLTENTGQMRFNIVANDCWVVGDSDAERICSS